MNGFDCLTITPIELAHPGLAVATVRAGGIGILDREYCRDRHRPQDLQNLDRFLSATPPEKPVGLRLRCDQFDSSESLLEKLENRYHWLIVSSWNLELLTRVNVTATHRKLCLEITDIDQILSLNNVNFTIDGIIAKGHESGGWVGEDSTFILIQKLIEKQSIPVYAQGGIGIHTVAACRAVGAAGVVLDDQLWLMRESPFLEDWKRYLRNLNGQEAIAIGERVNATCRVLSRPGFQAIERLQKVAEEVEIAAVAADLAADGVTDGVADGVVDKILGREDRPSIFYNQARPLIGWGDPGQIAWPMGQTVGLAATLGDRYKTTGRLIKALLNASKEQIEIAKIQQPLAENSPLATSHKTRYPIVQGPMTRVSDKAEFADAISQAGALPLLALALMRGEGVKELLVETKQRMGERSWGIGILGFVPQSIRQEQLPVVRKIKPPFALIAGGRPDQAAELESLGIATYLHVPVPRLLQMFLEQGARRFVFEGRECGGHVGPLSSFMLWESMISTLLESVPKGAESDIHVLFAGGIHDSRSATMISAMAAPLASKGMKVGVLMGSAYLFTEEAVTCGAIVKGFQERAVACDRTINLETGPGHASRCAVTPFAREFYQTRRRMLAAGKDPEEIKNALEALTLGRLRIASKGLTRDNSGTIIEVEENEQLSDGMYMIGQVATLRDRTSTIKQLHRDVSQASSKQLADLVLESTDSDDCQSSPCDIAIIGIATLLPKAQYPETFWQNIIEKVNGITEIPASRWDWRLYYSPERDARDKINSKWGGFFEEIPFDPTSFGIPPKSVKSIEPSQLLTLEMVRRALVDAGYAGGDFDRENTAVILGAGGGIAELGGQYAARSEIPRFVENVSDEVWERFPEWTSESFPGLLLNVLAGRVANRFDFGGANFTVDAACASSLAAVDLAVKELETGRCNVAIAGGVDTGQGPFTYFCFSKTQALSPQGVARSFDKNADGIVISEGIAIVVLKRLADARADGDRIYAVIKSVASSSDGKGLSMTAPLPAGQQRALKRAYNKAGFSANTLGLYEAHGTGTVAGDRAEVETITHTLQAAGAASKSCVLGSVKTAIGHTKSTAGVAALVKVALSLYHKTLPPHLNVVRPLDAISNPESPVYLLKEARPWLANPEGYPRRGAVSAFGFGGTNFHAILEEERPPFAETNAPSSKRWPWELLIFKAANRETLTGEVNVLLNALQAGAEPSLADLAYTYAQRAEQHQENSLSLTLVVKDLPDLKQSLELARQHLAGDTGNLPPHIQISPDCGPRVPGPLPKIAFLFPGQGSQYPNMAREVALYFPGMRDALEFADSSSHDRFPKSLSQYIYPPSAYSETEETHHERQLTDTRIAQPALGTVEMGFLEIIRQLGITADMVAGHSYGEYAALYAAGVLSAKDLLHLSVIRGRVMADACDATDGAMAAIAMKCEDLLEVLGGFEKVVLANHNAPLQSVISGDRAELENVVNHLQKEGMQARILPVAGPFHSPLVESAQAPLGEAIARCQISSPQVPVYSNSTGRPYDSEPEAIGHQLSAHLLKNVKFVSQVNAMYADGARIFIEVGPKSILTKLVGQILDGKEHTAVSLDGRGSGLKGLLLAVAMLVGKGVKIKSAALFAGRNVKVLELSKLVESTRKPKLPATAWFVNGGSARMQSEAVGYAGTKPPLTLETKSIREGAVTPEKRDSSTNGNRPHTTQGNTIDSSSPNRPSHPLPHPLPNQLSRPLPHPLPNPLPNQLSHPLPHPLPNPAMSQPPNNQQLPINNHQPTTNNYPLSPDAAVMAYQAYQETMRQFLRVQESVMQQFLGGTSPINQVSPPATNPPQMIPPTPVPPIPSPPPIPPVMNNGNGAMDREQSNGEIFSPNPTPQPLLPNRESLARTLLNIVSDRTGYPQEMLGLDQDLEAELGIDSIKRVEILGALGKVLPEAIARSIPTQMETLTRVKTLNGLISQLLSSEKTTNPLPDRASLTQTLLNIVSDRTGYPPEMLGLDQDLEAELGIDSIKRVEILGALGKVLPEAIARSIPTQMETLTRVKTLNSLIKKLLETNRPPQSQSPVTNWEENGLGKSQIHRQTLGAT